MYVEAYMCVCIYVCLFVCKYIVYDCIYQVCVYLCIYVCLCDCMYVCICMNVSVGVLEETKGTNSPKSSDESYPCFFPTGLFSKTNPIVL